MSSREKFFAKLKTALREARDCFVFYRKLIRRTAESNRIPWERYHAGLNRWSVPTDNILQILRGSNDIKKYNLLQEEVVADTFWYAVPRLRPDYLHYSKLNNFVKRNQRELIIPQNETREVVDIMTTENNGEFPGTFTVRAQKNARVTYVLAVFGEREITKDITLELHEGAEGRIVGVIIGSGKARFTLKTTLRHSAPRTKGDIKVKMVLKDAAYVSYDGLIKIDKPAQQTNSYLDARALILDRGATCDGKPELEIEADDVKASHAFSSGKIDPEHIFYLRSRGLSEKEAERMIVEGFLTDVIAQLSKEVQGRITEEVRNRL